ncbi:MAG: winged helix-turn-helix domain-containing protein, partial [Steroidobacteraceae bacterium]
MPAPGNRVYRFLDCTLEPAEHRLSKSGTPVALTPKVFDTLVILVERAGHVVSKDELIRILWPRGYVDESNLTKHIWLIRRALGDGDHDASVIETLPKLGYRFAAPVTVHSGEATAGPAPPVRQRRPWIWATAVIAVSLVLVIGLRLASRHAAVPAAIRPGVLVAFVGFSNLSHNPKDAWLSPALTEMLGAELNVANDLQVMPDELVRSASSDLASPAAGGYAPQTLARLRQRIGADYVISGSYLVSGSSDDAPLRVDIALQDARTGSLVASVSKLGGESGLLSLVTDAGSTLRSRLGIQPPGAAALGLVIASHPPSVDVARRLGFALDALQHYDAARARDELLQAIAAAPDYAPAYTLLAQSWSALGYRDKARDAAEQAVRYAMGLPPEQRLLADATLESARNEWNKAAEDWQALVRLKPASVDHRLQCIDAQLAAGLVTQAQAQLRDLRRLPNSSSDPRVELAAARIAAALNDARGTAEHAANALREAQQHDAQGLVANALLQLAAARMHLGQNDEARANLTAAIAASRALGNPRGEAAARGELANVLVDLSLARDAREEFQRAMSIYQGIGDVHGTAAVYRDLTSMLWVAGDRDGAQAAARHSLQLARETGDLPMQAWTLRALATIASDDAASDEVLDEYRQVVALSERIGDRGGDVWSLTASADVDRLRGSFDDARTLCARATAEAAKLSDPQFAIYSGYTCALLDVDEGNEQAARAALAQVIGRLGGNTDVTYRANSQMTLAQLDMDGGQWRAAAERLRRASRDFGAAEEKTGEADAEAMLALCSQHIGDATGRDKSVERARTLRQSISARQEIYVV